MRRATDRTPAAAAAPPLRHGAGRDRPRSDTERGAGGAVGDGSGGGGVAGQRAQPRAQSRAQLRAQPRAQHAAPLLVLLLLLLCATPAAAQESLPDLPTYTAWVREAAAAARDGDRIGVDLAAERLAATTAVLLDDGTRVPVDNATLVAALRAPDPDLDLLATQLGARAESLTLPAGSTPADAQARLAAIYAGPPFYVPEETASTSTTFSWLTSFFAWLGRVIDRMFGGVTPPSTASATATGQIFAFALLVALLVITAIVGRTLLRGLVVERRAPAAAGEDPPTSQEALARASDEAALGDFRTAMRMLYLAALLRLDERDLLRYDRALTNREHLERLHDRPALRAQLAPVVETFDRVWYGDLPLDAAAFAEYRARVEALGGPR